MRMYFVSGLAAIGIAACAPGITGEPDAGSGDELDEPGVDAGSRPSRPEDAPPDAAPPPPPPCVEGNARVEDPVTKHCYILVLGGRNWSEANTACAGFGPTSHLVTVTSAQEMALVDSVYGNFEVWAGGNDIAAEGTWTWTTGEPMTYLHWDGGEPNNDNGGEDCMVLRTNTEWNDGPCTNKFSIICERE